MKGTESIPLPALREAALRRGAAACGLVAAGALAEYPRFLEACRETPPGLAYLSRDPDRRADIRNWYPAARSVLVCAFPYWGPGGDHAAACRAAGGAEDYLKRTGRRPAPGFAERAAASGQRPRISRFALSPDYHRGTADKLKLLLSDIAALRPGAEGRFFVDTSPVLEKELGRLAGLGFRGKNTLLVSPVLGSYFFIGGLALTLEPPPGEAPAPVPDGCGNCSRCVEACPTGALTGPGRLRPELCVSYWNTQARTPAPEGIIEKCGGYAYGCDICQEVCPYNG